jgi:hypothetical protein
VRPGGRAAHAAGGDEATRRMLAGNAHRVIHADDIAAGGGVGQSIYY